MVLLLFFFLFGLCWLLHGSFENHFCRPIELLARQKNNLKKYIAKRAEELIDLTPNQIFAILKINYVPINRNDIHKIASVSVFGRFVLHLWP